MKRTVLVLIAAFLLLVTIRNNFKAQGLQPFQFSYSVNSATASPVQNQTGRNIGYYKLSWNVVGVVSACTVSLVGNNDGSTTFPTTIIAGQDCHVNGQTAVTAIGTASSWIAVNPTVYTQGNAGSLVVVTVTGFTDVPGATSSNPLVSSSGGAAGITPDPCTLYTGVTVSGSISTSTTIISGTASKKTDLCGFQVYVNGTATNWALVEGNTANIAGTGAQCNTNLAATLWGGTTAAAGPNFITNQGAVTYAPYAIWKQALAGDNYCLMLSAANQVNWSARYVVEGQ